MILRNSINSILRTRGKTALFTALIALLTLFLYLGIYLWQSSMSLLEHSDSQYSTIATLEYLGADYPDESVDDPSLAQALAALDDSLLSGHPSVLDWAPSLRMDGILEGYESTIAPYPYQYEAVLVLSYCYYYEDFFDSYNAHVPVILYSGMHQNEIRVILNVGDTGFEPEYTQSYLVTGYFYSGGSSDLYFMVSGVQEEILSELGLEGLSPYTDITGMREEVLADTDNPYARVADYYRAHKNTLGVTAVTDLENHYPFHQNQIRITRGRSFTQEEYDSGAPVCVISQIVASQLGVGPGGSVTLSVGSTGKVQSQESREYTVVGIYNAPQTLAKQIYVPGDAQTYAGMEHVGYTVGQAHLQNGAVEAFLAQVQPLLPSRMNISIYDQGYAAVADALMAVGRIAMLITLVCALVTAAVLTLFAYLFVYKQRDSVEIMMQLGTRRRSIYLYLLWGAGLISLLAVAVGGTAGWFAGDEVALTAMETAADLFSLDLRFSSAAMGIMLDMNATFQASIWLVAATVCAVLVLALVLCALFARKIIKAREPRPRRTRKTGPGRVRKSSQMRGGALKFALLSIRRGGLRTAIVPVVCAVIAVFVLTLASSTQFYEDQLADLNQNTVIRARFTDTTGKQIGGLVVSAHTAKNIYDSGYAENLSLVLKEKYLYRGLVRDSQGNEYNLPEYVPPVNQYAWETFLVKVSRQPDLVFTGNFLLSPEFFYGGEVFYEMLPGYDLSMFSQSAGDWLELPIMVSTRFLQEHDLALGDTISMHRGTNYPSEWKIVGSFSSHSARDNIYAPLWVAFDMTYIADPEAAIAECTEYYAEYTYDYRLDMVQEIPLTQEQKAAGGLRTYENQMHFTTFDSVMFTVKDVRELSAFKDYLIGEGFSEIGKLRTIRSTVLLEDKQFIQSVNTFTRNLRYMQALAPVLYALIALLSFVVSYLMMVGRRGELAVMRSMGTGTLRVFGSFFLEQAMLCIGGSANALAVWAALRGVLPSHLIRVGAFVLCYLAGSAIAVCMMNRKKVLAILAVKE